MMSWCLVAVGDSERNDGNRKLSCDGKFAINLFEGNLGYRACFSCCIHLALTFPSCPQRAPRSHLTEILRRFTTYKYDRHSLGVV